MSDSDDSDSSSPVAAAGNVPAEPSTSAIVVDAVTGSHVLKVEGYGGSKSLGKGFYVESDSFDVGCDLTVVKEIRVEPARRVLVAVHPPDMQRHLGGQLLSARSGADITFQVGDETFAAHRCVLAARSPVFMAWLFGPMKQRTDTVRVNDMEARVFKAMLHFIYTDSLPEVDDDEVTAMAQHLLVAADRYGLERLKLICEETLCNHVDKSTAATTLALAEQHQCDGLREACFNFLSSPSNLKAVMASDDFDLISSCPSLIKEMAANLDTCFWSMDE